MSMSPTPKPRDLSVMLIVSLGSKSVFSNLRKEGFILAYNVRGSSPSW